MRLVHLYEQSANDKNRFYRYHKVAFLLPTESGMRFDPVISAK